MEKLKLSIIIPAYNEENTIFKLLNKVIKTKISIKKEIIIINDGSTDNTLKIVEEFIIKNKKKIEIKIVNKENEGKGSAVKLGIKVSTGDILIIQDADLEYDPNDYQKLIEPILKNNAKVVYGSRLLNKMNKEISSFSFYIGGLVVTKITNLLYRSNLTDEPTCYKVFKKEAIKDIQITKNGFEWEPEITAKLLKKGINIQEVPISYYPRSRLEGKKISWKDGLLAIWTLIKYRFIK